MENTYICQFGCFCFLFTILLVIKPVHLLKIRIHLFIGRRIQKEALDSLIKKISALRICEHRPSDRDIYPNSLPHPPPRIWKPWCIFADCVVLLWRARVVRTSVLADLRKMIRKTWCQVMKSAMRKAMTKTTRIGSGAFARGLTTIGTLPALCM